MDRASREELAFERGLKLFLDLSHESPMHNREHCLNKVVAAMRALAEECDTRAPREFRNNPFSDN